MNNEELKEQHRSFKTLLNRAQLTSFLAKYQGVVPVTVKRMKGLEKDAIL